MEMKKDVLSLSLSLLGLRACLHYSRASLPFPQPVHKNTHQKMHEFFAVPKYNPLPKLFLHLALKSTNEGCFFLANVELGARNAIFDTRGYPLSHH